MSHRQLQRTADQVSGDLHALSPKPRVKYRLTRAVSIWAAFLIAAVSLVFAQDVQPSIFQSLQQRR
jgi:hypothetical protein